MDSKANTEQVERSLDKAEEEGAQPKQAELYATRQKYEQMHQEYKRAKNDVNVLNQIRAIVNESSLSKIHVTRFENEIEGMNKILNQQIVENHHPNEDLEEEQPTLKETPIQRWRKLTKNFEACRTSINKQDPTLAKASQILDELSDTIKEMEARCRSATYVKGITLSANKEKRSIELTLKDGHVVPIVLTPTDTAEKKVFGIIDLKSNLSTCTTGFLSQAITSYQLLPTPEGSGMPNLDMKLAGIIKAKLIYKTGLIPISLIVLEGPMQALTIGRDIVLGEGVGQWEARQRCLTPNPLEETEDMIKIACEKLTTIINLNTGESIRTRGELTNFKLSRCTSACMTERATKRETDLATLLAACPGNIELKDETGNQLEVLGLVSVSVVIDDHVRSHPFIVYKHQEKMVHIGTDFLKDLDNGTLIALGRSPYPLSSERVWAEEERLEECIQDRTAKMELEEVLTTPMGGMTQKIKLVQRCNDLRTKLQKHDYPRWYKFPVLTGLGKIAILVSHKTLREKYMMAQISPETQVATCSDTYLEQHFGALDLEKGNKELMKGIDNALGIWHGVIKVGSYSWGTKTLPFPVVVYRSDEDRLKVGPDFMQGQICTVNNYVCIYLHKNFEEEETKFPPVTELPSTFTPDEGKPLCFYWHLANTIPICKSTDGKQHCMEWLGKVMAVGQVMEYPERIFLEMLVNKSEGLVKDTVQQQREKDDSLLNVVRVVEIVHGEVKSPREALEELRRLNKGPGESYTSFAQKLLDKAKEAVRDEKNKDVRNRRRVNLSSERFKRILPAELADWYEEYVSLLAATGSEKPNFGAMVAIIQSRADSLTSCQTNE